MKNKKLPHHNDHPSAMAGEAFNVKGNELYPSWISGQLEVPPGGIKEPEGVENCTQLFFVQGGQTGALEVAIAKPIDELFDPATAQRLVLNPGDEFYVPPKNSYMLWNHSEDTVSTLRFVILKPTKN